MFSQVGVVRVGWQLDYVGRVDQMQQSWEEAWRRIDSSLIGERTFTERMRHRWTQLVHGWRRDPVRAEAAAPPLALSVGKHASSSDPLGHRHQLLEYLRRRPKLHRALCTLLQPEYACFSYDAAGCDAGRRDLRGRTKGGPIRHGKPSSVHLSRLAYGERPREMLSFDDETLKKLRHARCDDPAISELLSEGHVHNACASSTDCQRLPSQQARKLYCIAEKKPGKELPQLPQPHRRVAVALIAAIAVAFIAVIVCAEMLCVVAMYHNREGQR